MEVWTNAQWRFVTDDDGHNYIIPADKKDEFQRWVEYMESDSGEEFDGDGADATRPQGDYSDCRIDSPSSYVITGSIERK